MARGQTTRPAAGSGASGPRRDLLERQRENYEESLKVLPSMGRRTMGELLALSVEDGQIALRTPLRPWQDFLEHRVDVDGLSSPAVVAYSQLDPPPFQPNGFAIRQFEFKHEAYPDADTFVRLHLSWRSGAGQRPGELTMEQSEQTSGGYERIIYRQLPTLAQLIVFSSLPTGSAEGPQSFSVSARNFIELRQQHAGKVEIWLRPAFTRLLQDAAFAPDANTAWQVLAAHWPAADAVRGDVLRWVARLDAPDWRARDHAAEELARLGRDGATQILRLDRRGLSVEQNVRLDEVLSRFSILPTQEARRLASDPLFLLDCEYSEDATVRAVALEQLARVRGRPIPLNVDDPPAVRAPAIEKLRAALSAPATRPADH